MTAFLRTGGTILVPSFSVLDPDCKDSPEKLTGTSLKMAEADEGI